MATIGSLVEGSIIQLKENGTLVDFYVAKHDYESNLNGTGRTLVVRKDVYNLQTWNNSRYNSWANSSIHDWLNDTYKSLLDADIQNFTNTTTYYTVGNNNNSVTNRVDNIFLLSLTELGKSDTYSKVEGSSLPIASILQIAYLNGSSTATSQWTRSPITNGNLRAWLLNSSGDIDDVGCDASRGCRPAFTLPASMEVPVYDKLGDQAVGSIIYIEEDGTDTPFIIVDHNNPASGRTTLLRQKLYQPDKTTDRSGLMAWGGNNSAYSESSLHTFMTTTYFNLLDNDIRPYITDVTIATGSSTMSANVFALSGKEVITGFWSGNEGTLMAYFTDATSRQAERESDGDIGSWWTRTQNSGSKTQAMYIDTTGALENTSKQTAYIAYARPAFTLPSTLKVVDQHVVVNHAPTAPASITVPETVNGNDALTVSWSASTDTDGNLAGYILERSENESVPWTQVYDGAATSTTNTVAKGLTSVRYRVKAYDSDGAESAYTTSNMVTVINNVAPSAPASITVPDVLAGSTAEITWTAATDTDGTIASYTLERKIDGGSYTQIYNGANLSYTDTIGDDWATVSYRVCATDNEGATGPYTTGETKTVNSGYLVVNGPSYTMGDRPAPFNFEFYVTDSGLETLTNITAQVVLNDETIYSSTTLGSNETVSLPIDTRLMQAGTHTIDLTVSKDSYMGFSGTYTFVIPTYELPDGGSAQEFQNPEGSTVFPITLARYVFGKDGKDVNELLGDGLKIASGYYTGTGTYGSSNLTSLTFEFVPKYLMVTNRSNAGFCPLMVYGQPGAFCQVGSSTGYLTMTWDGNSGKTVSWYGTTAELQLNNSGQYYFYVAIG